MSVAQESLYLKACYGAADVYSSVPWQSDTIVRPWEHRIHSLQHMPIKRKGETKNSDASVAEVCLSFTF